MGYYCTVPQCTSLAGKTKNVKFHRFPRDLTMADKWNTILKRGKPYTKYSKVCSLHFTQNDYNVTTMGKNKGQWKTLNKDAVPSQNLPKLNPDGTLMVIRKSRTVKYKETKKDDIVSEKDKWSQMSVMTHTTPNGAATEAILHSNDTTDNNLSYRLQSLNAIADNISPQQSQSQTQIHSHTSQTKPKKQDAFMQTDPVQSEEDDNQQSTSQSEISDNSFNSEQLEYPVSNQYPKDTENHKKFEPKDYTKSNEDYIPQTNEEYNKEAEKYALDRKSHVGYEKPVLDTGYQKPVSIENGCQKITDNLYNFNEKQEYQNGDDSYHIGYQNGYPDSEMLRNKQHNLHIFQEQHRITENQNFFNENHIKQEMDINNEEEKFLYDRTKEQLNANMYNDNQRAMHQRLLEHQVKQEPESVTGCDNVMQPENSYFPTNEHNNGGYYEQARPGPELLIAKQNALAAHTQLWQNTMKRPFFYHDSAHYTSTPQLIQRYEDIPRVYP